MMPLLPSEFASRMRHISGEDTGDWVDEASSHKAADALMCDSSARWATGKAWMSSSA